MTYLLYFSLEKCKPLCCNVNKYINEPYNKKEKQNEKQYDRK